MRIPKLVDLWIYDTKVVISKDILKTLSIVTCSGYWLEFVEDFWIRFSVGLNPDLTARFVFYSVALLLLENHGVISILVHSLGISYALSVPTV